jgi:ATP-dependent Clp protease ATP-binding subunit ClpA
MLALKGYDSKMGARPLSRKIDELIRVPLSKKILFERLSDCDIMATMVDDAVHFEITPCVDQDQVTVLGDDGIIRMSNEV